MDDDVYKKLAKVLDTIPPGFPATNNGVEIRLLKMLPVDGCRSAKVNDSGPLCRQCEIYTLTNICFRLPIDV